MTANEPSVKWHYGFGTNNSEAFSWKYANKRRWIHYNRSYSWIKSETFTYLLVVKIDKFGKESWRRVLGTQNRWDVGIAIEESIDGSTLLRSIHHYDGNIKYANYIDFYQIKAYLL